MRDPLDLLAEFAGVALDDVAAVEPDVELDPEPTPDDPEPDPVLEDAPTEVVIEAATGRVRQAGADAGPEGQWIAEFRRRAETSLFVFAKGVLGRAYLSADLHRWVCGWLQRCPPNRKLLLLPREHAKTTIVSHALPLHVLIQPAASNLYFPTERGVDQRIILACETESRAKDHIRVIEAAFETNRLLRALWPYVCWDVPRRDAKKWNDRELIVPRETEYPDPSIRAIGVDGAITGAHPTVLLKDDLISVEAANSPIVMQTAIDWHIASRALINDPKALEFIIGTRWAVSDLYEHIERTDPTVEIVSRAVVEDGRVIYPEKFALTRTAGRASVEDLQKQFGVLFPLLYMNSATDPELTDFDPAALRLFEIADEMIRFAEDERDATLSERLTAPAPKPIVPVGRPLREALEALTGRDVYLRAKYG